jgi:hypothetical protein
MRQPRDLEELLQAADDHRIMLDGEANRRDLPDPDDRFMPLQRHRPHRSAPVSEPRTP